MNKSIKMKKDNIFKQFENDSEIVPWSAKFREHFFVENSKLVWICKKNQSRYNCLSRHSSEESFVCSYNDNE